MQAQSPTAIEEAELWRRFATRVRLFGVRHLDRASADDLVQQVMLVLLDALRGGKVREPEKLGAFVLGTARHLARDWQRGERRRGELLAQFGEVLAPSDEEEVEGDERLGGCLDALAERERLVVVATFYGEEKADSLGARLGLEPGHVRVIRHRAVQRLQRCMGTAA